jgi:hypothetical protein
VEASPSLPWRFLQQTSAEMIAETYCLLVLATTCTPAAILRSFNSQWINQLLNCRLLNWSMQMVTQRREDA